MALPQFRITAQFDQAGDPEIQLDFAITIRRQSANPPKVATGKRKASRLKAPGARESHLYDSGTINGERSLLRKLGHHGNTLEHIQGSEGVDMKEMDKAVKGLKKEVTMKKGEMTIL